MNCPGKESETKKRVFEPTIARNKSDGRMGGERTEPSRRRREGSRRRGGRGIGWGREFDSTDVMIVALDMN